MLRIGQVEATATQDGKYTDGSVAGGIAATRLRAAAFNAMQEELAHIVESAGLALDINDMTQVLKAIQKLTLSRANPFADIKSDGAAAISTALTNLGLGNLVNALIKTNNLSDLPDKAVSRTNLGVPKGVDKQMANEWAVLSGITTVTIGDSLGISSIVRTALGTYTVNLSKPYSSINYAVMGRFIPFDSTDSLAYRGHDLNVTNQTTSSFTLSCPADYGADYRLRDASELSFAVFGAKP